MGAAVPEVDSDDGEVEEGFSDTRTPAMGHRWLLYASEDHLVAPGSAHDGLRVTCANGRRRVGSLGPDDPNRTVEMAPGHYGDRP
jgi:hypothetical protein